MRISNRSAVVALAASLVAVPALEAQVWEVGDQVLRAPYEQDEAQFGAAMAVGDFDGDGIDDLAVGAPGWDTSTVNDSGLVWMRWGASANPLQAGWIMLYGSSGPSGAGEALAAGDFDGDGRDELAVGAPMTDVGSADYAGIVVVWEWEAGSWTAATSVSAEDSSWSGPEDSDAFGRRLAAGDFNGDALDDLAIAVPGEDWLGDVNIGSVNVFYGSALDTLRTDNDIGFKSPVGLAWEEFGYELAAGDFDDDGFDDLAVGVPKRTVLAQSEAGAVEIYSGSAAGLVTTTPQLLQDNSFIAGAAETGDRFGAALAAANYNQSTALCVMPAVHCYADLAIGVPGQLRSGKADAGKVVVAYGSATGLSTSAHTVLGASAVGALDEEDDQLGSTLAAGRLDDGNLFADLAIGVPFEDFGGETNVGAAHLVFGGASGLNSGITAQSLGPRTGLGFGVPMGYDYFGIRLAIGDFDGDGWGDLAIGAPIRDSQHRGLVQILYGALFADGFEIGEVSNWSF